MSGGHSSSLHHDHARRWPPDRYCSGVIPEHSYGGRRVNRVASSAPAVAGDRVGGGSASAVVDVCVATHMRGLVPHDRMCEMRSGAVLWRRAWPVGLLTVFSRVAPRVVAPVRSPRRAVESGPIASSRAPSSVQRARARPRPRQSSAACLAPRVRASVRAAGGRCARLGLAPREACRLVCARA